jgi:hypothetical protein
MRNSEDNFTLIPSDLDTERLRALEVDGRVEAENRTWVILRYPASEVKGWQWCEYSLIVNCMGIPPHPAPYEFKNLKALLSYLDQLEKQRLPSSESQ